MNKRKSGVKAGMGVAVKRKNISCPRTEPWTFSSYPASLLSRNFIRFYIHDKVINVFPILLITSRGKSLLISDKAENTAMG
jgi:hypothetical protein